MQTLCRLGSLQATKCKHFTNSFFLLLLQIIVNFLIKWQASKAKYFERGQKPFASGFQVKNTLCKWLASGLQVVHKPFASDLLATNANTKQVGLLASFQI